KFPHLRGASMAELAEAPELLAELQGAVDEANKAVSRAEAVRRFRVLPGDFTEQGGHLTPSLKVRRSVIMKDCADEIEALYSCPPRPSASCRPGPPGAGGVPLARAYSPARISVNRRSMISQRHSCCTQAMPFSPIAWAAEGSLSRRFSRSARSATLWPDTRYPVSPSRMASGELPQSPPTTGSPVAAASRNTMPRPSTSSPRRRVRQGIENTFPASK